MKKLLCVILLTLALCATAFAADLTPMITIDPADFANGSYSVTFAFAEGSDTTVNLDIYQQDYFDCTLVEALQAGDTITTGEGTVTVETVEADENGWVIVNGGFENYENGGLTLMPEGGEYVTLEDDDYHSQTLQGSVTYELADTVKFQHFIYDDEKGLLDEYTDEDIAAADLKAAIEAAGMEDYPCSVTVEDSKITIVMFHYCP